MIIIIVVVVVIIIIVVVVIIIIISGSCTSIVVIIIIIICEFLTPVRISGFQWSLSRSKSFKISIYFFSNTILFSYLSRTSSSFHFFFFSWSQKQWLYSIPLFFLSFFLSFFLRVCPRDATVKTMDCGIVVCEFVLQSRYYVHFRANTLGKGMNTLYPPNYALISITTVLLGE